MRRPKKQEAKVQSVEDFWPPKWFFTYSDLATLLMTFFMVLATMVALKVPTLITTTKDQKDQIPLTARELRKLKNISGSDIRSKKIVGTLKKIKKEDIAAIIKIDEVAQLYEKLKDFTTNKNLSEKIGIERLGWDINMNISSAVLFNPGSYNLSNDAKEIGDFIAEFVKQNPCRITIEGHTDNQPIHTPEIPSNWELSVARADSLMRYLIEKQGLPTDLIEAVGYGEHKPIAPNDTPEGRAHNRRLVITLTPHSQ